MITTRSPYRVSFFGGGTDYADWFNENGGAFLSLAINYYTYITLRVKPKFQEKQYRILWRLAEEVQDVNDIQHPIVRETLKKYGFDNTGLDISYIGDLPGGSGMGSSSSFTAALLLAIKTQLNETITPYELSNLSYDIEKNLLKETVGIQDQIATSFGGFNKVEIAKDGNFEVVPVNLSSKYLNNFLERMVLVYTGTTRRATEVASKKVDNMKNKILDYRKLYEMVPYAHSLLLSNDFDSFGELMHEAWKIKRELSDVMSNTIIDDIYNLGVSNGALGGKLLGAGGGGFILFMCKEGMKENLISKFKKNSIVPFKISSTGTQVVYNEGGFI
jgi:D-glycero-alpha-D-manno-heptose-7-phosphate kinase